MALQRNFYEIMGLNETATQQEIKVKYRELARKFHPDLVPDKVLGQKVFSQINQSYRMLSDPDRRAEYDRTLSAERGEPLPTPAARTPSNGQSAPSGPTPLTPKQSSDIANALNTAEMAVMHGQSSDAETQCRAVLQIDAGNVKALDILGDVLAQLRRLPEALNAYETAEKIAPSVLLQSKINRTRQRIATESKSPSYSAASRHQGSGRPPSQPQKPSAGSIFGKILGRK